MNLSLKSPVLALRTGEVITLDDAEGTRIHAQTGTVWITEEDDVIDHIVGAGDDLVIAHPGRTVVQALVPSRISIRQATPEAANEPAMSAA